MHGLETNPDRAFLTMIKKRTSYDRLASESRAYVVKNDGTRNLTGTVTIGSVIGKQVTDTTGHPISLLHSGKNLDIGGFFYTTKQSYREEGGGPLFLKRGMYEAEGAYALAANPAIAIPTVAASSVASLVAFGTTAIARTLPTNPHADISTFLGELRQGLPSMVGRGIRKRPDPRGAADEYLNWEFALRPLLNDFRAFGQSFVNREKILRDFIANAEKRVRRRYSAPDDTITTSSDLSRYSYPAYVTYLHGPIGVQNTETVTTTKRWFSGAYSYHYPEAHSLLGQMQGFLSSAKLLAGLPSVETLWNLAPWSWAVDWFTNVGDIIHNFNQFSQDGLVIHYGYVMEHKKIVTTRTWKGSMYVDGKLTNVESRQIWTGESKIRIAASPFGFGLSDSDLTPRQKAIGASLGLARL